MFILHGFGLVTLFIGIAFYFLPAIIGRNKRNAGAILLLNLLLGWTIIGWICALVWACTSDSPSAPQPERLGAFVRFCYQCGKPCNTGARFCDGCGAPLGSRGPIPGPPGRSSGPR